MTFIRYLCSVLSSICLIVALLIGSIELCCFYQRDFFTEQYAKEKSYETVGMSLDDLSSMTDYMLDYLQGKYDTLTYKTIMWGEQRDFFNDREKAHMIDVQRLNLGAVQVMRICLELFVLFLLIVLAISFKLSARDYAHCMILKTSALGMLIGTGIFAAILGTGAYIAIQDFDAFWTRFHLIFFTNDLWLLNPATDMLINVTTETLFEALVARCAITFCIALIILLSASIIYLILAKKKGWMIKLGAILLTFGIISGLNHVDTFAADEIKALDSAPEIVADYAMLIDADTGEILYSKNAKQAAYPASTTKVMTALLTLENSSLNETVVFSKSAIYALTPGASHIGMKIGEELSVEDCLYGLLLPSANEVANALAEHVDGTMAAFVDHMNTKAASLGCINTHFANPNGLHDEQHTTCAYDLALIFRACINTPGFTAIDAKTSYVISPTNLVEENRPMRTTHQMMRNDSEYYDSRVICGKTGHTDQALGCLLTYAQYGGRSLICVVMHSLQPAQYTDTKSLLDYGFTEFSKVSADTISEYLFASKDAEYYRFCTNAPLPLYSLSSNDLLLLPSDLSKLEWSISKDTTNNNEIISFSSGSLSLGTALCNPPKLEASIYTNVFLPVELNPKIQIEKKSSPMPIIFIVVSTIAVIILLVLFFQSRAYMDYKKKHKTHIIKNPGTKNIKI